jgi:hypothetical protein
LATAIITSLVSFILVSVAGTYLGQTWQRAAWAKQQTFLGREKEYEALKTLTEEIATLCSRRLYASRQVLVAVRDESTDRFEQSVTQYAEVVREWNTKLQSFYVRLTFYASCNPYVYVLENYIHKRFYALGIQLEKSIRRRRILAIKLDPQAAMEMSLNNLEGQLFRFNRDLIKLVERRRQEIYYGVKIPYDAYNFRQLSTFELLQLIFKPRMDIHGVFRPSFDLTPPDFRGLLGTGVHK